MHGSAAGINTDAVWLKERGSSVYSAASSSLDGIHCLSVAVIQWNNKTAGHLSSTVKLHGSIYV